MVLFLHTNVLPNDSVYEKPFKNISYTFLLFHYTFLCQEVAETNYFFFIVITKKKKKKKEGKEMKLLYVVKDLRLPR